LEYTLAKKLCALLEAKGDVGVFAANSFLSVLGKVSYCPAE
jgi:hypothetical protein